MLPLEERITPFVGPLSLADLSYHGDTGRYASNLPTMSTDGQLIAFKSRADNLVPNDFNNRDDIFVYDRSRNTTQLVSVGRNGFSGNNESYNPIISPDGRYVAFTSAASSFVAESTSSRAQVYVRDLQTQTTRMVSLRSDKTAGGNGNVGQATFSGDGRHLLFTSNADNLVAGVTTKETNLYWHDLDTGITDIVSVAQDNVTGASVATGGQTYALSDVNYKLSFDGRYATFFSPDAAKVAGVIDANGTNDLFVRDMKTRTTRLVNFDSLGLTTSDQGVDAGGAQVGISNDGTKVLFVSTSKNLGTTATNGSANVYVRDLVTNTTELVSVSVGGGGDASGVRPTMTPSGRYVAFVSGSDNLVATDTNGRSDIFLRDLLLDTTTLISANAAGTGSANAASGQGEYFFDFSGGYAPISADGRYVGFVSIATDLTLDADGNAGERDVYYRDTFTSTTTLVSVGGDKRSSTPVFSSNFKYVAFESDATNLIANDGNRNRDIFVRDLTTKTTVAASGRSPLLPAEQLSESGGFLTAVTPDGRYVLFQNSAGFGSDVTPGLPVGFTAPVLYRRDTQTGQVVAVNITPDGKSIGGGGANSGQISADGRYVTFYAGNSDLDAAFTGGTGSQVYQRDMQTGVTKLVSVNGAGGSSTGSEWANSVVSASADGRYVAFNSSAQDLVLGFVDNNGQNFTFGAQDVFIRDLQTGVTKLVSHKAGSTTESGNSISYDPIVTLDGKYVIFVSQASDLVAGITDTNPGNGRDVFAYEIATGNVKCLSLNAAGTATGNNESGIDGGEAVVSADGRYVAFGSYAGDIDPLDPDMQMDVFRYDLQTGARVLVSVNQTGTSSGNLQSNRISISANGNRIAFTSRSSDLTTDADVSNGDFDIFVRDLTAGITTLVSFNADNTASSNSPIPVAPEISPDGKYVAFASYGTNVVNGFALNRGFNNGEDSFIRDLANNRTLLVTANQSGTGTGRAEFSNARFLFSTANQLFFDAESPDLVNGDRNALKDVFVYTIAGAASIAGTVFDDLNGDGLIPAAATGPGLALQFSDFRRDQVFVPYDPALDPTAAATLETWVKFDLTPSAAGRFISLVGSKVPFQGFNDNLQLFGNVNNDRFTFEAGNTSVASITTIQAGVWYHVAGTYSANGFLRIYVNGVLESSLAISGVTRMTNGNPLIIGGAANNNYGLVGTLDDVRVWGVARSAAEIAAAFQTTLTGTEPGLAAYYTFNEAAGTAALDRTPAGRHGLIGHLTQRVVSTAPITGAPATDLEFGRGFFTVYLDLNGNSVFDANEPNVQSDIYGGYRFNGLSAGTYTVRLVAPPNFVQTAVGAGYSVTLPTDTTALTGFNFGTQRSAPDLVPSGISATGALTPGGTVTISWLVTNNAQAGTGDWTDAVFLSATPTLGPDAILLGSVAHVGGLAPGASYAGILTTTVPAVANGTYYVIVQADARNQADERVRTNNVVSAPVTINIPVLTLNTPTPGNFSGPGMVRYYRLTVTTAGALAFTLTSLAGPGELRVVASRGVLPTLQDAQFDDTIPNQAGQFALVPMAAPGEYYVAVFNVSIMGPTADFTLTATQPTGVTLLGSAPNSGGNTGPVTVDLRGLNFTPTTTFRLVNTATGALVTANAVDFLDSSRVYATFDLTGAAVGLHDIVAQDGAANSNLFNAFSVVVGVPAQVNAQVIAPAFIRTGREHLIVVEYTNTGNTDALAPLLRIEVTPGKALLRPADRVGYNDSGVDFLALNTGSGPARVLQPGQTYRAYFRVTPTSDIANDPVTYQLYEYPSPTTPIDWVAQRDATLPTEIDPAAWTALYANYIAQVGTTTGSYTARLAARASYLSNLGATVPDVSALTLSEFLLADESMRHQQPVTYTDAGISTPGVGLSFERVRNSTVTGRYVQGLFGLGWSTNWDYRLRLDSAGNPQIRTPLGGWGFAKLPDGTFAPLSGGTVTLTATGSGYILAATGGERIAFRADGLLDFIADAGTNRVTAGYSGSQLVSLTHTSGATLTLAYNGQGLLASVTDSESRSTTYAYDTARRLTSATDASGTTAFGYLDDANPARNHALRSITLPGLPAVEFEYDDRGRLSARQVAGGASRVAFAYDGFGGVTTTDLAGGSTTTKYNLLGQPELVRDALGRTSTYDYDRSGALLQLTTPAGTNYRFTNDNQGRRKTATDAAGKTVSFTYEAAFGLLASVSLGDATTSYEYTSGGQVSRVVHPDGSSEGYSYDAVGQIDDYTNRRGQVIDYTTDTLGRITRRVYSTGGTVDYTYDARSNLLTTVDASGTTSFTYDPITNRLTRVDTPNGRFLSFAYDTAGRRTQMAGSNGYTVNYTYNAAGLLEFVRDGGGALVAGYTYDNTGLVRRVDLGNGTFTTYDYDLAGQLTSLINHAPGGAVNSSFAYVYNNLGQPTRVTTPAGATDYAYDDAGQLVRVTLPTGRVITYEYDVFGTRTRVVDDGVATNYTSNAIHAVTAVGSVSYSYDADGNLTTINGPSGTSTFTYNPDNQLTGQAGPAGTFSFEYDAFGSLRRADRAGVVSEYLLDPFGFGDIVAEYDGGGALVANYTHGANLLSRTATGATAFYDFDVIGNTAGLTDATGNYVNRYEYLPFGETTTLTAGVANPFTFVGASGILQEAGRFQMRARSYDPVLGQFTSDDPLGLAAGDFNIRRYVKNAPTQFIDPSGLVDCGTTLADPFPALDALLDIPTLSPFIAGAGTALTNLFPTDNLGALDDIAGGRGPLKGNFAPLKGPGPLHFGPLLNKFNIAFSAYDAVRKAGSFYDHYQEYLQTHDNRALQEAGLDALEGFLDLAGIIPGPAGFAAGLAGAGLGMFDSSIRDGLKRPPKPDSPKGDPKGGKVVRPCDPNDISGPIGFGLPGFLDPRGVSNFLYSISYENDPVFASAPAQDVIITHQLDADLDWTTFEFAGYSFGKFTGIVPARLQNFQTDVEYQNQDGSPLLVNVSMNFDLTTGVATWTFRSLDPATGSFPEDALAGFLPVNDGSARGEGLVDFLVQPKADLPTDTAISATASIVFDINTPVITNTYVNTIDIDAPTASVNPLPATTTTLDIPVAWTGTDPGSGIARYDVFVSVNGGAFTLWLDDTTTTTDTYAGTNGASYGFFVVATDNIGLVQTPPTGAQATTTVNVSVVPPVVPPPGGTIRPGDRLLTVSGGNLARTYTFDAAGQAVAQVATFAPFPGVGGVVRSAAGDFNGDGVADMAYVTGPGGGAFLRIVDGKTGQDLVSTTNLFPGEDLTSIGLFVAAGDVDGDGKDEVAVSADQGGGPRVKIYTVGAGTLQQRQDFLAIEDPNFRGGARIGMADLDGDGKDDLLVSAGFLGGPRIALWNGANLFDSKPVKLVSDFFAFEPELRNGAFVAGGDMDGDGRAELIFGAGPNGAPRVFILSYAAVAANVEAAKANSYANFFAFDTNLRGGIRVAAKDADGDGKLDLVVGSGEGEAPLARIYPASSFAGNGTGPTSTGQTLSVFDAGVLANGVFVG
jgi:RHS repeat-associated protein